MATNLGSEMAGETSFRRVRLDDACMKEAAILISSPTVISQDEGCKFEIDAFVNSDLLEAADEVVLTAGWDTQTIDGAVSLIKALRRQDKAVAVVGTAVFNDMTSLSMMLSRLEEPLAVFLYRNLRSKFLRVNALLEDEVMAIEGARYLDKLSLFCERAVQKCNMLDADGRLPIWDASHLTMGGLDLYSKRIYQRGWF